MSAAPKLPKRSSIWLCSASAVLTWLLLMPAPAVSKSIWSIWRLKILTKIVDVNYRGVFLTCKYAGRVMREQGSGNIITVSSIFGQEPYPRVAAYSGSKAGVIALTLAFALEMAPHNVRVNTIAPGYMATEMQWEGLRQRADHAGISFEEERQRVWDLVPLGRHGTPEDMGALVAFLASDDAAYITGVTLGLAGGVVRR